MISGAAVFLDAADRADSIFLNTWDTEKSCRMCDSFYDVSDKIRTRDLLVRSQTLYPAELHLHNTSIL